MDLKCVLLAVVLAVVTSQQVDQTFNNVREESVLLQRPAEQPMPKHDPKNKYWKIKEGDVCNIKRHPLPAPDPKEFFECLKPTDDAANWPWEDIGVWVKRTCRRGRLFSPEFKICRSMKSVRRQQAFCNQFPNYCGDQQSMSIAVQPAAPAPSCTCPAPPQPCNCPSQPQPMSMGGCQGQSCQVVQPMPSMQNCMSTCPRPPAPCPCPSPPRPCPLAKSGGGNAQPGGICSWMLDPLMPDPSCRYCFLQCQPSSPGEYCGRWRQMPCAAGTRFEVSVQVCVHDENATPRPLPPRECGQNQVSIGSCNQQQQCPGQSQCMGGGQGSGSCCVSISMMG